MAFSDFSKTRQQNLKKTVFQCDITILSMHHLFSFFFSVNEVMFHKTIPALNLGFHDVFKDLSFFKRQRDQVVRTPVWKSGGRGFKSRSDHSAGVVYR